MTGPVTFERLEKRAKHAALTFANICADLERRGLAYSEVFVQTNRLLTQAAHVSALMSAEATRQQVSA